MHDLSSVIFEDGVDVLLLQEPWVNDGRVCGLPGGMRVYECEGGMAAIVVANGSMEAMLPVEAALDYMNGCLDIGREGKVIIGIDANACSGMWYSKPSRRTRDNEERASKIEEWMLANGVRVLNQPSEVYSFCAQGMSDIDVTVCKGMDEWRMEWMVRDDRGTSDHNPIYVDVVVEREGDSQGLRGGRHWKLCESKNAHMAASLRNLADSTGYGTFFGLGLNEKVEMIDDWMRKVCNEHLSGGRKRNDRLKWWTNELEELKRGVR
uniref:Endonuclease/exonuclease/phosphatase domain-containing protein n=1 Tax=Trichogramma kaykai TaxID=54128 RepID=A0ABD2W2A4_9HYME